MQKSSKNKIKTMQEISENLKIYRRLKKINPIKRMKFFKCSICRRTGTKITMEQRKSLLTEKYFRVCRFGCSIKEKK